MLLKQGVQSISDLILLPGLVNLDFADVTAVMKDAGYAHMGVGRASGKDKAEIAANMAISSPLLETAINGAKGVIINITSSPDIGLDEIETASAMISDQADPEANIIWGAAFDENMQDEMSVTVIATGFDDINSKKEISSEKTSAANTGVRRDFQKVHDDSNTVHTNEKISAAAKSSVLEEDDTFYDIMSIFNRK